MWWVPIATAVLASLVVFVLHYWHQRRQMDEARSYRARFVQLVAQLETITGAVNQLGTHARSIKEPKLLDYYESTLRVLETLLAAVAKIPAFGSDPTVLDSAFYLVKDCRQRIGRTQQGFQDALRGKKVKIEDLYAASKRPELEGCYFCSRPVLKSRFARCKVRIDGEVKDVLSCKVCKEELETTKKVKVLYFMKEGRPIHWSEVPDYQPSEDFWNINRKDAVQKTRKLELVPTNPDQAPPK